MNYLNDRYMHAAAPATFSFLFCHWVFHRPYQPHYKELPCNTESHRIVSYRIASHQIGIYIDCDCMRLSIVHTNTYQFEYTYFSQYDCCQMHVTSFILCCCHCCCWLLLLFLLLYILFFRMSTIKTIFCALSIRHPYYYCFFFLLYILCACTLSSPMFLLLLFDRSKGWVFFNVSFL